MQDEMDSQSAGRNQSPDDDLSALAWVHGELRRALETAHKALRRYLKESDALGASDVDAVDPAVLRSARNQIHQGVGALELVGLPAAADVLRASELAVQRMMAKPVLVNAAAIETIERVSFGLLDLLSRQLAGKAISPVALFPQYRAALQLAGADRVHPADLWKVDWQWRELPPDPSASPRQADDDARSAMETLVLALMRHTSAEAARGTLARISDLCADLGAGARQLPDGKQLATFWQLAGAVHEAQSGGLLAGDVYTKRLSSRLLAQMRMSMHGQRDLSDRLAQDLLFFCSHALPPDAEHSAPRLAAVRKAWRLDELPTSEYEKARLGRFDPAQLALAKKRVAAAKDSWSAVAGGEQHRAAGLNEQFALVGDSLHKLFPEGEVLAQALQATVNQTVVSGLAPAPALAMEVATGILYLDASLEDGELDQPELPQRVIGLAKRIDEVREGAEPRPLDAWMEDLYRRVSDRQTMGSVVQELRASLSEIEKQIDQYFRNPVERQVLIPVPAQLSAMRGVLSVLGLDQASQAALHMRDDVDALAQTEVDPQQAIQTGTFDRLADNLGALSFLIDMISVQPQLAKSLFRFDPATGSLSAVMGQTGRVSAFQALEEESQAPEPAPAPSPPLPDTAPVASLVEQVLSLVEAAAQPELADEPLAQQLERVSQLAVVADQRELARRLARAATALRAGPDARPDVQAELGQALVSLVGAAPEALPPPMPVPPPAPVPAGGTGLEEDAEMREIFIEEAREVVADAHAALERLADDPENAGDMTAVRRAFHTLKGSSRMVGLRDFGEAAWACEQLYNARLAQAPRVDGSLRSFTTEALGYLGDWTEAIDGGVDRGHNSLAVTKAADSLRLSNLRLPIEAPIAAPVPTAVDDAAAAGAGVETLSTLPFILEAADESWVAPEHGTPAEAVDASAALSFEMPEAAESAVPALAAFAPPRQIDVPIDLASSASAVEPSFDLNLDWGAPELPTGDVLDLVPAGPESPLSLPEITQPLSVGEPTVSLASLLERVPDLPSAADMDLALPLLTSVPEPEGGPEADVPDFELDLSSLEQGAEGDAVSQALASETEPELDLPLSLDELSQIPVPEVQALDFDQTELQDPFEQVPALHEPDSTGIALPLLAAAPWVDPLDAALPAETSTEQAEAQETYPVEPDDAEDDQVKLIGHLRIGIPLFNIYLNEADELSRRLVTELAEWTLESQRHPVPESSVALAHSLAGSSATVGYTDLSALARALEHALMRSHGIGYGRSGEAQLFNDAAEEIRRLLHQFAAGFLRAVDPELMARLAEHERLPLEPATEPPQLEAQAAPPVLRDLAQVPPEVIAVEADDIDVADALDSELFPIFEEEAEELLPQLQQRLREWLLRPGDSDAPAACMRTLHTFKGGARLAGALRLGEMAHRLETMIEQLATQHPVPLEGIEPLPARADSMVAIFEALVRRPTAVPAPDVSPADWPAAVEAPVAPEPAVTPPPEPAIEPMAGLVPQPVADLPVEPISPPEPAIATESTAPARPLPVIDWGRFAAAPAVPAAVAPERAPAGGAAVRVRAGLLDRLVNQAGEVSITRARIDADVKTMQGTLVDLTDSLERMRRQLREIELQAETQISTRLEAAKAAAQTFDPLEMDRFTRFQELTRFMAESVNDVATLQRGLQRTLQSTEDELAAQARLTRELQDDLLRTRMIEFDSLSERLHRTVRQAAKETGKQMRLEIIGGAIEIDRGVLERMVGSFEHLLRNSVAHGVELPQVRQAAGKDATGLATISVTQAGNEVAVEFADDGAGLDLARIRARALERGLHDPAVSPADADLAQFIFQPGFSTTDAVTELAGRGVGLDVVRAEVNAMGGRIETHTQPGAGTRFRLLLPLTTAVTQVVMLRCAQSQVAVPSPLIELVRRVPTAEVGRAYEEGWLDFAGARLPFFWLSALLNEGTRGDITVGRTQTVVIIRSAAQRVAVHVDEVVGNQEVVVKNVGPQLSRLPGLAGVTLLPSGQVALIYNPVALATLYADTARALGSPVQVVAQAQPAVVRAPMVLVVDDSLTVRRVTQRLLVREGYRVVTAKDGMEALERLAEERPVVLLSDIEMPRMDGFDLVRNVRADARLAGLPVVMITSRIAQKHRDYAAELGVQHYLGKPYSEEELLSLVARYAGADIPS